MSIADDRYEEIRERLERAWRRCLYGRNYSLAYQVADKIKQLRRLIPWAKRENDRDMSELVREMEEYVAKILVTAAVTDGEKLREIADALKAEENADPRQANLIKAYEQCIQSTAYPPTLADLKKRFINLFGEQSWTSDFAVRKTLKALDLPLGEDRRGRPPGARNLIRN